MLEARGSQPAAPNVLNLKGGKNNGFKTNFNYFKLDCYEE